MSDTENEHGNADLNPDLDLDALITELAASFPSINDSPENTRCPNSSR
jgi:hypothetical protein